ncbi:MAG: NAD(P)(+) transhydrogenase (Re/Si-specific) subunit alpha, partial [Solirubrobacteraceae bacterium]
MRIGVPKETAEGERRVALVPEVVTKLVHSGGDSAARIEVVVQRGAGAGALIPDDAYAAAGAQLVDDAAEALSADVVVKVSPPSAAEIAKLRSDSVLVSFLAPLTNGEGVTAIAATGATSFALESVPRISRAQSMDALSSQANISGYRSALIGAQELGRFFPML